MTVPSPPSERTRTSHSGAGSETVVVAIHQPNYLPNLGFFHKLASCDLFVVLDDAQYNRGGFVNRNRVKTPAGCGWLTVPVRIGGRFKWAINHVMPDWKQPWIRRHRQTLAQQYAKSPFYDDVMDCVLDPVLTAAELHESTLCEMNTDAISRICSYMNLRTPVCNASEYTIESNSTRRLVEIVTRLGGTTYLSGLGAKKYLDPELFDASGLELVFSGFVHPKYPQRWGEFIPNLSVIDALFNCGPDARSLLGATQYGQRPESFFEPCAVS
jgi:WbqC-like protein family